MVKLDKELVEEDRIKLLRGIIVEKRKGRFKKIKLVNIKDRSNIEIECVEGRNHFVKKMFNALNYNVKKLNRSSFAGIKADIPVGMYRKLNESEVQNIVSHYINHKPPISNQSFNR